MICSFTKDPDSTLDYQMDWTTFLSTDTIASSTWSVAGYDAELIVNSTSNTSTTATVWLSGGTVNVKYNVTNKVTTASGRVVDRSFTMLIVQK